MIDFKEEEIILTKYCLEDELTLSGIFIHIFHFQRTWKFGRKILLFLIIIVKCTVKSSIFYIIVRTNSCLSRKTNKKYGRTSKNNTRR